MHNPLVGSKTTKETWLRARCGAAGPGSTDKSLRAGGGKEY